MDSELRTYEACDTEWLPAPVEIELRACEDLVVQWVLLVEFGGSLLGCWLLLWTPRFPATQCDSWMMPMDGVAPSMTPGPMWRRYQHGQPRQARVSVGLAHFGGYSCCSFGCCGCLVWGVVDVVVGDGGGCSLLLFLLLAARTTAVGFASSDNAYGCLWQGHNEIFG